MTRFVLAALGLILSSCAVGPDYVRPDAEHVEKFKEAQGWKLANPNDHLARGQWWSIYGDAELDALMDQVNISNQTIKQAEAQYRSARALVQSARAAYFPTVEANASASRSRSASRFSSPTTPTTGSSGSGSGGGGGSGGDTSTAAPNAPLVGSGVNTLFNASLDASWELDLWGRLRRSTESAEANAAASEADLEGARLSAQAELAQDYFQLRVTDEELALLKDEVTGFERSLKITQNQYAVGVAGRSDILQAQTQLKSTQAQLLDLQITRAQFEHAIAVLTGKNPSNFSLPAASLTAKIPVTPLGLPSELLERRPDIAGAERRVISANAQIGVARAAFFPSLSLAGTLGYQSSEFSNLVSAANRVWSVGPSLALTLFDAGARRAASRQALANYDASVASYRQTTLAAFQDVEDNLIALRVLNDEQVVQDEAAKAARDAETIVLNQYKAGTVSYLNVVIAQSTALTNARSSLDVRGRNLLASVGLIRALGGGWTEAGSR